MANFLMDNTLTRIQNNSTQPTTSLFSYAFGGLLQVRANFFEDETND